MRNRISGTYRLADKIPVALKNENGKTTLNLERPMLDPMAAVAVAVVQFDGPRVEK